MLASPLQDYPVLPLTQALHRLHPGKDGKGVWELQSIALSNLAELPSLDVKTTHLKKEARWMAEVPTVLGAISHGDTEGEATTRALVLAGLLLAK